MIKKLFVWLKDDDANNYQVVYVPTFKSHCVGIRTNGKLKVEMKYQSTSSCFYLSNLNLFIINSRFRSKIIFLLHNRFRSFLSC